MSVKWQLQTFVCMIFVIGFIASKKIVIQSDNASYSDSEPEVSSNILIPPDATLQDICALLQVPLINCSCDFSQVLCDLVPKKNKTVIYVHRCPLYVIRYRAIINLVASFFSLLGNGLVILVTFKHWTNSGRFHKLIGGLAVADFVFSCVQSVFSIPRLWTCKWIYGLPMCRLLSGVIDWLQILALGLILIIAIERYFGIVHPLHSRISSNGLAIMIALLSILGIVFVVPSLYYTKLDMFQVCREEWPSKTTALLFSWSWMILFFLLPIIIIVVLYEQIMSALNRSICRTGQLNGDYYLKRRLNDNRRIMKILVTVVVAFSILVFPNRIVWLIVDHLGASNINTTVYEGLSLFGFIPYTLHVAINPVIYSLVDSKFRERVSKLFYKRGVENVSFSKRTNTVVCSLPENSLAC